MNSRDRVIDALSHKETDRVPKYEWYWQATLERWKKEGLGDKAPCDAFDLDIAQFNIDTSFLLEEEVIRESDEYIVYRDEWGCVVKNHRDFSTTPMYLEFPVKNREMWEKEYKPLMKMDSRRIKTEENRTIVEEQRSKGRFVAVGSQLNFAATWRKVGMNELLVMMVTDPEFVEEMFRAHTELILQALQGLVDAGIEIDGTFFAEDMSYKNAMLFSPEFYRRFLKPFHKEFFDFCHKRGWKSVLHSCGCVKEIIPDLVEIGLDCLQPLEAKAGMNVVELKREYGRDIAFMGGIDAREFTDSDAAKFERHVAEILERVKPDGGYVFMSDHSIPPMPLNLYKEKLAIVEKYLVY